MQLLEREADLRVLEACLARARDASGSVAVVEGEAGIGKTELLVETCARAREMGARVLSARGGELEREFALGVARQLFEPALADQPREGRRRLLAGAAARAASALGLEDADALAPSANSEFVTQHALYWLAANLAGDAPLVLCVDDAHWADNASLRWLVYLARRLEGTAIMVLVGWRLGEPASVALLDSLRAEAGSAVIAPAPLSEAATAAVIRRDVRPTSDDLFCSACHTTTGGNPFLLGQLVHALVTGELEATAEAAAGVRQLGPPIAVSRSVLARLARLSDTAVELARAVAILDTDATLMLAARVAQAHVDRAEGDASELIGAHLLAPAAELRFTHPILRSAVYFDMATPDRSVLHRRAAKAIDEFDGDPGRVAAHLLATAPSADPWVVEQLLAAGKHALARGAPDAAFAIFDRALAEPPAAGLRGRVLLERGRSGAALGRLDADDDLAAAMDTAQDLVVRGEAGRARAEMMIFTGRLSEGVRILDEVIANLDPADRELIDRLEVERVALTMMNARLELGDVDSRLEVLRKRATPGSPAASTLASLALHRASALGDNDHQSNSELLAEIGEPARLVDAYGPDFVALSFVPIGLMHFEQLDAAHGLLTVHRDAARRCGSVHTQAVTSATRARVNLRLGRVGDAAVDATEALELARLAGADNSHGYAGAILAEVHVVRGELDAANAVLAASAEAAERAAGAVGATHRLFARAQLRLAEGRAPEALADIRAFMATWASRGGTIPPVMAVVLASALYASGAHDEANRVAAEQVERARSGWPDSAVGVALHTAGLVAERSRSVALLEEAVSLLIGSPRRLDAARAAIDLGAALRRGNQRIAARSPLHQGMLVARECGAEPLVTRAHEELLASGARPRRLELSGLGSLTPSERRLAMLAGQGLSNPEIAQALFITRKTVEKHLSATYRKLDVRSREELAALLAQEAGVARSDRS